MKSFPRGCSPLTPVVEHVKPRKQPVPLDARENEAEHARVDSPAVTFSRVSSAPPPAIRPADILAFQQTIGNQAVQRLLARRGLISSAEKAVPEPQAVQRATQAEAEIQRRLAPDTIQRYTQSAVELKPQPNPEPMGNSKRIQRFAEQTFTINSAPRAGTLSENGKYFMLDGPMQSGNIFATSTPSECTQVGSSTYSFNSKTYALYAPVNKFLDDCLHSAEEIVNGRVLAYGKATYSRETTSTHVFGQSDKRNIEIAEAAKANSVGSVDGNADAGIGNAFVIVDTEFETKPSKRSPYHAAGVIGVDGSDRITMEVFASGGSLDKRETDAKLSMYTVGGGGASFHGYWSGGYFSAYKTITIVIRAK